MIIQSKTAKVGDIPGGDYLDISKNGTLRLQGDATVWDDLRVSLDRAKITGANVPTFGAVNSTSIYAYHFDAGDEILG